MRLVTEDQLNALLLNFLDLVWLLFVPCKVFSIFDDE